MVKCEAQNRSGDVRNRDSAFVGLYSCLNHHTCATLSTSYTQYVVLVVDMGRSAPSRATSRASQSRSDVSSSKQRHQASVYDAVAGRVFHTVKISHWLTDLTRPCLLHRLPSEKTLRVQE